MRSGNCFSLEIGSWYCGEKEPASSSCGNQIVGAPIPTWLSRVRSMRTPREQMAQVHAETVRIGEIILRVGLLDGRGGRLIPLLTGIVAVLAATPLPLLSRLCCTLLSLLLQPDR